MLKEKYAPNTLSRLLTKWLEKKKKTKHINNYNHKNILTVT